MRNLLLVGAGGFIGSVARYALAGLVPGRFPLGTLLVNVLGCLVIGALAGATELSAQMRLLVVTGVLGGFTTFSAFGLETFTLLRSGATSAALLNVVLHLAVALPAVWAGYRIGAAIS